jgi:magnesium transporter
MKGLYSRGLGGKVGQPPGTLVFVGEKHAAPVTLNLIDYTGDSFEEMDSVPIEKVISFKMSPTVTWLNVTGLSDTELVESLCTHYGVHLLVQEDILHTNQRPKVEVYDDHIFMVMKMIRYDDLTGELDIEQVSVILGKNFVITFQEKAGDVFEPLRERIRSGKGRVRRQGPDYLAYALMDAVVDNYFLAMEKMGEDIEALESDVMERPNPNLASSIHRLKRELILLRRAVWPLREGVSVLMRDAQLLVSTDTLPYLRDLYDHTIAVMDTVESFRDMASGLLDIYLSSISNRMNQVMKVLTIIATIFIPLTFIAGIYGMNFENMPELSLPWAYPAVLILCLAIALTMIAFFRRKGWF